MENTYSAIISLFAAVGLAASSGFRVFVPFLVVSAASRAGLLELNDGFLWIGSTPALISLSLATALEIAAFYIPTVDNALDAVATPAAVIAGTALGAAVMTGMDPWLRWTLAVVAGGGLAAVVQLPIAAARGASTLATAGLANPAIATGELVLSSAVSAAAVLWPLMVPVVLALGVWLAATKLRRRRSVYRAGVLSPTPAQT